MVGNKEIHVEAHVGQKSVLSETRTLCVHFHHFANQKQGRGKPLTSPPLLCHGRTWKIEVVPRGCHAAKENYISFGIFLCEGRSPVTAKLAVNTTHSDDSIVDGFATFESPGKGWADWNFLSRSDALDPSNRHLIDGTLTITVDIQICAKQPEVWTPPSTIKSDWLALLTDTGSSDVLFKVKDKTFRAHRFLLGRRAPDLACLCEKVSCNEAIEIDGVNPDRFHSFLQFIYTDELPGEDMKSNAREILEVADKFGCISLKLLAEAHLTSSEISVDTTADLLLLADSKSCPVLKEAAIRYFVLHSEKVIQSEGYVKLKESPDLMTELIRSVSKCGPKKGCESMSVSNLRRRLHEGGEDIDGTREALVKRFKAMEEKC